MTDAKGAKVGTSAVPGASAVLGTNAIPGTQVVGRVTAVLRAVSQSMPEGESTSTIAAITGIARPTAHRLLSSLLTEGFVDRDRRSGRWLLGPELYLLGTVAAERYDITTIAQPIVRSLAEETGESAFLSVRRGNETVCILRAEGSFPIRSFVLYEGKRFPLGVASAGIAILSFMAPDAIDRYLASTGFVDEFGGEHGEAELRNRVARTRELGYAINPGLIVEGSWGMGAAVFDRAGQPNWALSLTGIQSRFEERLPQLGALLMERAHDLTLRVSGEARGPSSR